MNNTPLSPKFTKNISLFFGIVLIISLPFYILASLVPQDMTILMGLTLALAPITAGLILTYRENGSDGAKRLLKRSFDYKRITNKKWYLPILFLWPVIFILASGIMTSMGETTPDPLFPVIVAPILFVLFFIFALFEEIGWMGYAFEPMENRWNALNASLILGLIWAMWHLPLYILAGQDPLWIAG
jgi:membrane protease YdiL (CAAX protease family)